MKSTIFDLDINASNCVCNKSSDNTYVYEFTIPSLPAFAIEYFTIQIGALSSFPSEGDSINNDKLILYVTYKLDNFDSKLVIHYHGIRDYGILFSFINNSSLKERLGEFYYEAEVAFENALWLSFMLMCGAIFEGILFSKLGENKTYNTFNLLISQASQQNIINDNTASVMNKVREYRNLVHANKHASSYVSRSDAMDTRTVLDKLIKSI